MFSVLEHRYVRTSIATATLCLAAVCTGGVPNLIDFQGSLTDGDGVPVSGQKTITFTLYDADTGGQELWQEALSVNVLDGIYSVALGSVTAFTDDLWEESQLWLGVKVGEDEEMAPRVRIVAVPYALRAKTAETLVGNHTVPYGAILLSATKDDPNFLGAGYASSGEAKLGIPESWTVTSLHNAPSKRSYHSAVWTGSLVVVWGGRDENNDAFQTGARYSPDTDTWEATSTINAPSARHTHTAVWAGERMIVFGGVNVSALPPQGGRYDPASDTWQSVTLTGTPEARSRHTAISTGAKMIVWGGSGQASDYLQTGGVYDPQTDVWTATTTDNAPEARSDHVAVWTGDRMIVWGGRIGTEPWLTNTGGIYNPASDAWATTSTVNAPEGFWSYQAVWTGEKMVVWGDFANSSPAPLLGGIYDPNTNSWTELQPPSNFFPEDGTFVFARGGQCAYLYCRGKTARFAFSTGQWTTLTSVNGPNLVITVGVGTGESLIIWGGTYYRPGETQSAQANHGGVFRPGTALQSYYLYTKP